VKESYRQRRTLRASSFYSARRSYEYLSLSDRSSLRLNSLVMPRPVARKLSSTDSIAPANSSSSGSSSRSLPEESHNSSHLSRQSRDISPSGKYDLKYGTNSPHTTDMSNNSPHTSHTSSRAPSNPPAADFLDSFPSPAFTDNILSFSTNDCQIRGSYNERELNLVMYYLDHIFPRAYPYFKFSAADDGRGWLLNLLLRTKPLCSAAICLSACDQAQFVLGPLTDVSQPYHELEAQHIQSVVELRHHLNRLRKTTGASHMATIVESLACIIFLIMFEVSIIHTANRLVRFL
jgi:Fungal specific transcription factor domain